MALTRKMLKAMSIEDEKIDEIIEAHIETVDALKTERDTYKADAEVLPTIQKELDELRKVNTNSKEWEDKYNKLDNEFKTYKSEQATKEVTATKDRLYRDLLKEAGVSEKRIDSVMKVTDLNSIELTEENTIKDVEALSNAIRTDWADFIVTTGQQGAATKNPPANNGGSTFANMSLADKMSYANAHPDSPEVVEWLHN